MSKIIDLSKEELRKLQLIELEMLIEVDRICRKNSIKYSISSGTLLGAIRHKGFIPWDDDLDVMFLHEEYEKFYHACEIELDKTRFFFQDFRTDDGYRWGYGKIRRLNTEYIKSGQEMLKQRTGICIDIFDLQNVPDNLSERKKYHRKMFCIRKILYSQMGKYNEKNVLLRIWYLLLSHIPSKTINNIRLKICEKYRNQITDYVSCEMFPLKHLPDGIERKIFSEYVDVEFEGANFMAIKEWDKYLSELYGDYMKLPPIEKRVGVMNCSKISLIEPKLPIEMDTM